jgi:hypothetical protein
MTTPSINEISTVDHEAMGEDATLNIKMQIYMASAHMDLLTTALIDLSNDTDSEPMQRAAAGYVYLTNQRQADLQNALQDCLGDPHGCDWLKFEDQIFSAEGYITVLTGALIDLHSDLNEERGQCTKDGLRLIAKQRGNGLRRAFDAAFKAKKMRAAA